jgi:hypothetical protein
MEAKNAPSKPLTSRDEEAPKKNLIRIGRPGYKVTKSRDLQSRQRSLTFEVDYPEAGREIKLTLNTVAYGLWFLACVD